MNRYSRQVAIDSIGEQGQSRLRSSRVTIIGGGALGGMVAMQLAGAGVGFIRIADFDTIDISNLQRQIFFKENETGSGKALTLCKRIRELNSEVNVEVFNKLVTEGNIEELLEDSDFVVDATDNVSSKRMIDLACEKAGIGAVFAGVNEFRGQVMTCEGTSARYRNIFPDAGESSLLPCSVSGVIGPAVGVAASIQASEVIKALTKCGELMVDHLFIFDLRKNFYQTISFA